MAKKTIIENIADSIDDQDQLDGPVRPQEEVPGIGAGMGDDGINADKSSAFIPKSHVDDLSGTEPTAETSIDPMGGTEAGASFPEGEATGATDETPIVQPGETNAAPPSPGSFQPAGVISMDAPMLIKMLEHAKNGGDIHHMASQAAQMCGDPDCTHLGMDHFDELAAATPEVIPGEAAIDTSPIGIANGLPGEEGEPMEGPSMEIDVSADGGPEVGGEGTDSVEGEVPGGDPVGEAGDGEVGDGEVGEGEVGEGEVGEGEIGEDLGETDGGASEGGAPKDDKGKEKKDKKGKKDKGEKKDKEDEGVAENVRPVVDPILEKFQFPKRQLATDNKTDPVEADGKKGKKKSKKPWEKDKDEEDDESIAESVDRLTRLMSDKSQLIFKETQADHVTEFVANPNSKFNRVFSESVTKALANKKWLSDNGLDALAKYKRASIVNTPDMGKRHLLVLD